MENYDIKANIAIMNRLNWNFMKISKYIPQQKKLRFRTYLRLTLAYGLENGDENLWVFDSNNYAKHVPGEATKIVIPREVSVEISKKNDFSLSMHHNHPNNTAPTYEDYKVFFKYKSISDMAVCGHIGNLYFLQKKESIDINTKNRVDEILSHIQELTQDLIYNYMRINGYTVLQILEGDEALQMDCVAFAMDRVLDNLHDKGVFIYREGSC